MSNPLVDRLREALVSLTPARDGCIEALRPLYSPAVVFRDPIQEVRGIEPFLALNRRLLSRLRTLQWTVTAQLGTDDCAFLEWTMVASPKLGPSLELKGVTRARAERGLIVDHRDYWDMGELLASAIPGGPTMLHILRAPFA